MVLFLLLALVASWALLGPDSPGAASNGSTVFVPWVMKEAAVEEVAIVQRDGHKAIYWPSPMPPPPYAYPTPTPVGGPGVIPVYLEVENRTRRNVTGVTVDFRAFDSAGTLITQTVTQAAALVEVLRPGQRSPVAFNIPFPGGYSAFQAANKSFTLLPDWSYTENDTQSGLEIRWSPPWGPSPPVLTPGPTPLPNVVGWIRNTTSTTVNGPSVVVLVRGNDKAHNLVLEATRVQFSYALPPGATSSFSAYFGRDYGPLVAWIEAVAQRRLDIPGILEAPSW